MILEGKRIFIIEDNANNRQIMQLLVNRHGGKVAIETWGQEAVGKIHDFLPIDLIVLDLMLPNRVSGFDVFDLIRGQADLSHIPIVAVSAMEPSVAIPQAQDKGFLGFIPKPVGYARFADQLATLIKGEELWLTSSY